MGTMTAAWVAATAAAAAISWAGVNLVLREAVFGPPDTVFLPAPANTRPGTPALIPATTLSPAATAGRPTASPGRTATSSPSSSPSPSATPTVPSSVPPAATGPGRSYTVQGGQVSVSLGTDSATLLSTSPAPGWAVKVWRSDTWFRVDFTKDGRTSSVFVTWNGHPPLVDTYEQ
ncbi:hypothetical protein KCH_61770 [Kitasatospora cheerisanensis KCTC 2395]|uniref:Secreted protein n=2 Tax=Kitasatospora cheerisanensis TaxID=81942 RepID=A0A066YKK9_9ACTN|nr:hypothetical protein KCH_61770 [Kitasatospora cheerisanensis KCTC 2395]